MTTSLQRHHLEDMIESAGGERVLVATDFDGTLAPIARHPDLAHILPDTVDTLRGLADSGSVAIAVLSGRSLDDLRARVAIPAVLAGNHGLEIAGEGVAFEHSIARERADLISDATALVREAVAAWPGAWIENKRLTATVHFRQVDQRHHCNVAIAVRRAVARFGTNVGLRAGKCSLEIHPRVQWNKGTALTYVRRQLGMENSPVLCIGDDATDEAMFRALPGHVTVCVGQDVRTAAAYRVPDATAVGHALQVLCELVTGQRESFRTTA